MKNYAKLSRKKWKKCKEKPENFAKNTEFLKINAKFSEKGAKVGWTELDDILKFQKSFFFLQKLNFFYSARFVINFVSVYEVGRIKHFWRMRLTERMVKEEEEEVG